jgi:diadenosine tetraphosphate (Ap4A) HIT family hydrolase/5-methylcytosine-specific restriction endonuclease McrA
MPDLKSFIRDKMKMSHIYQPVMIKTLLEEKGEADKTIIAKKILEYDFSQVEYYENVTNVMVGKVLRNHDIVEKQKNLYSLKSYNELSKSDVQELIDLCNDKIDKYIQNRGKKIWEHRRRNRKSVPGSIRYKVLKRANGRCELCGISKDEKAIEVDHIVPKNHGGEDSINNYQALCYTCNANKRDTDDTDFRNLNDQYSKREKGCVFCDYPESRLILENNLAIAIKDKYPVTPMHTLIIPKRHCESYFDLSQAELNGINMLLHDVRSHLQIQDKSIQGFNVGVNDGETSGQTISHCHIHLIPRREGDVESPIGGVRNIIPGKGDYLS